MAQVSRAFKQYGLPAVVSLAGMMEGDGDEGAGAGDGGWQGGGE
jgi:hypothetical protein